MRSRTSRPAFAHVVPKQPKWPNVFEPRNQLRRFNRTCVADLRGDHKQFLRETGFSHLISTFRLPKYLDSTNIPAVSAGLSLLALENLESLLQDRAKDVDLQAAVYLAFLAATGILGHHSSTLERDIRLRERAPANLKKTNANRQRTAEARQQQVITMALDVLRRDGEWRSLRRGWQMHVAREIRQQVLTESQPIKDLFTGKNDARLTRRTRLLALLRKDLSQRKADIVRALLVR